MVALIEEAFHGQMQPVPVEVRKCAEPNRGEGVFALRQLERGEVRARSLWKVVSLELGSGTSPQYDTSMIRHAFV